MESVFELLTPPVRIISSVRLSDKKFLAFCRANEQFQFEQDETSRREGREP